MKYFRFDELPVRKAAIEFALRATNILKQLNGWPDMQKDSKIKRNRFLSDKDREKIGQENDYAEFDAEMAEFRRQHLETLKKRQQDTAVSGAASVVH
jgi:hypothetical protein